MSSLDGWTLSEGPVYQCKEFVVIPSGKEYRVTTPTGSEKVFTTLNGAVRYVNVKVAEARSYTDMLYSSFRDKPVRESIVAQATGLLLHACIDEESRKVLKQHVEKVSSAAMIVVDDRHTKDSCAYGFLLKAEDELRDYLVLHKWL